MKRAWTLALLAGVAGPIGAQQPPSVQQAYDAAAALDVKGTPAERLAAWSALEARTRGARRSHAIMLVREGAALRDLNRRDEAATALRTGLADLPAADETLAEYREAALTDLALTQEQQLDYASAAQSFAAAEKAARTPADRLSALIGQIRTFTFVDPDAAAAAVTRADALVAQFSAEKPVKALIRQYDAELRLNRGDIAGARAQAAAAVALEGGLKERTQLRDVPIRSDYGIASLLAGKEDDAREYIAMTGAGRLPGGGFDPAIDWRVPDCGGEDGLRPSDMAVVEFSVADDGSVSSARPVYAAGGGAVALAFARAVADWSWTPEKAKALPAFYRYFTRVELRCSTAYTRPSIRDYLDTRLERWLADKGIEPVPAPDGSEAAALPAERAALARAEQAHGTDALALVPYLHRLAANRTLASDERDTILAREAAILRAAGANGSAALAVDARRWANTTKDHAADLHARLPAEIARYESDPEARGAVRLLAAERMGRSPDVARVALAQVTGDTALPADSPIKAAAYVRLASLEQQAGHHDAARAAFAASHATADTCALIDTPPRMLGFVGTFPQEAQRWGFEGWTKLQFDIDPAGRVIHERTVASYPPFVFDKAGIATMASAQFTKTFRPEGALGCGGQEEGVKFKLPGH